MDQAAAIKYCLYARKSSESDERQAMSIESQVKEMQDMAAKEGLMIAEIKRESHSAKLSGGRPVFMELISDIREGRFNGILTWAPDRLSRNAGDLGALVDLMDSDRLVQIRTYSQKFSNNPNEKFLLMILCSQAKLENDNRAVNVKRGIRAKCEMGWRPCMPPLGYFTRASTGGARDVIVDEERAPYIAKMFEMSADGKGGRHIMRWLEENQVKTRKNKKVHLSMIYKMLKNSFYYGEFEYPTGSGNWYKGNHKPIITKELFNKVQEQLVVPVKGKWGAKEFPFKQFLKCASCGSSIVGEEKFKYRKDGTAKRFVYYHCSRQVDYNCKEPFVREAAIVEGLVMLSNNIAENLSNLEPGLQIAIDRFSEILQTVKPGSTQDNFASDYIRYVLQNGSSFEKTRLVRNLHISLVLHDREVIQID